MDGLYDASVTSCLVFKRLVIHTEVVGGRKTQQPAVDVRGMKEDDMSTTQTLVSVSDWL